MERNNGKKVAIVGAGICGLYLSTLLAKEGIKVFVFEKNKKVGTKKSSSLYSERIFNFIPEAKNFIENEIEKAIIHFPRRDIQLLFRKKFYAINREQLEEFLYRHSLRLKVNFFFQKEVKELPGGFERIIGADGSFSFVRSIFHSPPKKRYLTIITYDENKDESKEVDIWPLREKGFIWKIPRRKVVEYGILTESKEIKQIFENFLKKGNIKGREMFFNVISQGFFVPKDEKVTLCGEAAGLTKPWSGGGVIWGLQSANILVKNFPDFSSYRREVRNFFSRKIFLSNFLTRLVYLLGFHFPYFFPKKIKIDNDYLF